MATQESNISANACSGQGWEGETKCGSLGERLPGQREEPVQRSLGGRRPDMFEEQ